MSSEPVITLEGAGKAFALFSRPEDRFKQMLLGRRKTYFKEFWALQPTDIEIHAGETCGILGRNGSGKSTLLQMICGNLAPTTGRITVRGKVAALLELGAGFNPEFTGRENIYINGALAGFEPKEIDERMDAILGFADIGSFVEQPVKTYSSGMFVRLAFACAINVDPDILVVDEALAVGDARFQLKCFRRLDELKSNGTTILFVSHATELVKSMCDSALVLDMGRKIYVGDAKVAAIKYHELLFPEQYTADAREKPVDELLDVTTAQTSAEKASAVEGFVPAAPAPRTEAPKTSQYSLSVEPDKMNANAFGVGGASIDSLVIHGVFAPNVLIGGSEVTVVAAFRWDRQVVRRLIEDEGYEEDITLGISFSNSQGNYLFGCNGFDYGVKVDCLLRDRATFRFTFKLPHLVDGVYFLTAAIAVGTQKKHVQLRWYDCFIELRCETSDRTVLGVLAIDYKLESLAEDFR